MPFRSKKQRSFMYAKHPDIAKRWEDKYGAGIVPGKKKPGPSKKGRAKKR